MSTGDGSRLNVRKSSGKQTGQQPDGMTGTILNGPSDRGGYTWWKVNFDAGEDGWVVEEYLEKADGVYVPQPIPDGEPTTPQEPLPNPVPDPEPIPAPETSGRYDIGDTVQVDTGDGSRLNVRATANGAIAGQQTDGASGTVISGPVDLGAYRWWSIDFALGVDGWVAEAFTAHATSNPTPAPNPGPVTAPTPAPSTPGDWPAEIPPAWNGWDVMPNNSRVLSDSDLSNNRDTTITCEGTLGNPAGLTASEELVRTGGEQFVINGNDCVIHDITFKGFIVRVNGDRMVFKNNEVDGESRTSKNAVSANGNDQVILNNHIHHHQGNDRHGMTAGGGSHRIWFGFNEVNHNGGDGFQAGHGMENNRPTSIYLFNNVFYSDRENAIDLKYMEDVWMVENVSSDLVSAPDRVQWCFDDGSGCGVFTSGSDGSSFVIGSDGAPIDVHILRNTITRVNNAIRIEEAEGIVEISGNVATDIEGNCLSLEKTGFNIDYNNNVCDGANRGVFQFWRSNFSLDVDNNTFRNLTGPAVEFEQRAVYDASTLTDNIFESTGGVVYGNIRESTSTGINNLSGASGNIVR